MNITNVQNAGISGLSKYQQILEDAWQKHLSPRDENAPTVISTFAGCGGSSLGYSISGFREVLAVEWDDNAVATFKLNFPDVPVYHGDIAKLSVGQVLQMTGLKVGELDVFDGSPPCQGFSTSGKRQMDDPRNQLFREYVRLLRGLQPKVFVMENVSGMVKGKMKLVFAEILRELKASGYRVSARLLNAMYFNVPQSRERMIFIGVREDLGIEPSHPRAVSKPLTPKEAFINVVFEEPVKLSEWMYNAAHLMHAGNYSQIHAGKAFLKEKGNLSGHMNTKLLSNDRVSCTIPKTELPTSLIIHPDKDRRLTIPEIMRLFSFPDSFSMYGLRNDKFMRLGNSVPPLLMASISGHIRKEILSK